MVGIQSSSSIPLTRGSNFTRYPVVLLYAMMVPLNQPILIIFPLFSSWYSTSIWLPIKAWPVFRLLLLLLLRRQRRLSGGVKFSMALRFFHRLWQDLNVFVSACWDWLADFLICSQCWYSFLWPLFLQRATCLPGRCFSGGLLYYCYPQELIAYSTIRQDCSC